MRLQLVGLGIPARTNDPISPVIVRVPPVNNTTEKQGDRAMTQTLTIYGASDDLVEVEGIAGADEFNSDNWVGLLEAPDGSTALVYVDYRDNGTWTVTLGQFEEDYAIDVFAGSLTITVDRSLCGYSTTARLEVPDGTTIREWRP